MFVRYIILLPIILVNIVAYSQDNKIEPLVVEAPTNSEVLIDVNLSNIQFGKPFSVKFTMPSRIDQIIDIGTNINALGDTDLALTNITDKEISLSVTSYGVQPYPMPSLLITALDTDGNTNIFYTPGFDIPISNSIISNTNITFADIEPIYFVWDHLWTILLLLLFLVLIGIYFIPSLLKPREKKEKIIPIDPFIQVNTKLKKLKVQSLELNEENYKEFFVDLSETVREFISLTMIEAALELPTSDLLLEIKQNKFEQELLEIISTILKNTDRAKYAKQIFSQERIDEVMEDSFKIVAFVQRMKEQEKTNEL